MQHCTSRYSSVDFPSKSICVRDTCASQLSYVFTVHCTFTYILWCIYTCSDERYSYFNLFRFRCPVCGCVCVCVYEMRVQRAHSGSIRGRFYFRIEIKCTAAADDSTTRHHSMCTSSAYKCTYR